MAALAHPAPILVEETLGSSFSVPLVELVTVTGEIHHLDVPELGQLPEMSREIRMVREESHFEYDGQRRLVSDRELAEIQALEENVVAWGMFFRYPGVSLNRLRLIMEEGCAVREFGRFGGYFSLDFQLDHVLALKEVYKLSYRIEIDSDGVCEAFQPFAHEYPLDDYSMEVRFPLDSTPVRCWWFDKLPHAALPGRPHPLRLLSIENGVVRKDFGPRPSSPFYCGIGWEWS